MCFYVFLAVLQAYDTHTHTHTQLYFGVDGRDEGAGTFWVNSPIWDHAEVSCYGLLALGNVHIMSLVALVQENCKFSRSKLAV